MVKRWMADVLENCDEDQIVLRIRREQDGWRASTGPRQDVQYTVVSVSDTPRALGLECAVVEVEVSVTPVGPWQMSNGARRLACAMEGVAREQRRRLRDDEQQQLAAASDAQEPTGSGAAAAAGPEPDARPPATDPAEEEEEEEEEPTTTAVSLQAADDVLRVIHVPRDCPLQKLRWTFCTRFLTFPRLTTVPLCDSDTPRSLAWGGEVTIRLAEPLLAFLADADRRASGGRPAAPAPRRDDPTGCELRYRDVRPPRRI
eukprot:gene16805-12920_t